MAKVLGETKYTEGIYRVNKNITSYCYPQNGNSFYTTPKDVLWMVYDDKDECVGTAPRLKDAKSIIYDLLHPEETEAREKAQDKRNIEETNIEYGWVVEGKHNKYIGNLHGEFAWIEGHENALRLSRKEDAEAIQQICSYIPRLHFNLIFTQIAQHSWDNEN